MKPATGTETSGRSLWLWVLGGFILLSVAWAVMFTVARSARIETVPLATGKEAKP